MTVKKNRLIILFLFLNLFVYNCKRDFSVIEEPKICPVPTDSTSHYFTWTVDTLGEYGSILRDVAIISENEVWAVGELYGYDSRTTNLAIWNGDDWKFKHIPLITVYGDTSFNSIDAIFKKNKNEIWVVSSNGEFGFFDGNSWQSFNIPVNVWKGAICSIWASSSSNVYLVGRNGSIIHFNGLSFRAMNSQTSEDLRKIAGHTDPKTGQIRVWAGGTFSMLYCDDGENWQVLWDKDNPMFEDNFVHVHGLYIPDDCHLIASVWSGLKARLYMFNQKDFNDYTLLAEHEGYTDAMTGQDINDIFIVGDFNIIQHYNGNSTNSYPEFLGGGYNYGAYYKNNNIFIVGVTGASFRSIVIRGSR